MWAGEFTVSGMTCGHCELSVREEVSEIDGVTEIIVSAATGTLQVTAAQEVDAARIIAAVAEAGYEAVAA